MHRLLGSLILAMLPFHWFEYFADRGLRMRHYNRHSKVRLMAVVALAMLLIVMLGGRRAFAQPADASAAHETKTVNISAPDGPAASEPASADATDDADIQPAPDNSVVEPAPPPMTAAADDATVSGSDNGAVLEIPQVVNLPNGNTSSAPANQALTSADGNDDDAEQAGADGQDTAPADNLASTADQVGTLQDYENQEGVVPRGPIFFGPGIASVRIPPPLFSPLSPRPFGVPMAMSPIILPPTSSGPFPSTSPMLMAPRFGTPGLMGPRFGPGFMGFRR